MVWAFAALPFRSNLVTLVQRQPSKHPAPPADQDRAKLGIRAWLAALAVAAALPVVIFAGVAAQQLATAEQQATLVDLERRTDAAANKVERYLQSLQEMAVVLANAPSALTGDLPVFYTFALRAMAAGHIGRSVALIDPGGKLLLSTRRPFGAMLPAIENTQELADAFARKAPHVGNLFIGSLTGTYMFTVLAPVIHDGQVTSAVAIAMEPQDITALLLEENMPEGWIGTVDDGRGIIVARTRASEAWVGHAAVPEAAAAHALGSRGIYSLVNKEGVAITAYYVKLPSTEWKVIVGVPTEQLEAPVIHLLRFMLGLGLASLAMAGVLAFWIGQRMSRQITAVVRAAIAIGKGQEPARDSSNVREINEVSGALAAARGRIAAREAALRESETRQALLLRLVQEQRETNDPDAMMLAACEAVGRHLGANRVGFFDMLDDDTLDFTVGWADGILDPLTGTFPAEGIGKTYLGRVRRGGVLGIADVAEDPLTAGSIFASIGVRSLIGVPIIRNGRWHAGTYVNHATVRQWTAAEVALVQEVSEQTWDAVERVRATSALGESETSLRLSQQAGRIGSWDWDCVTGKLHWSELQCQQFGVDPATRDRITYDVLRNAVHPDDLAAAEAKLRAAFADGTDFEIEYRINTPDGVRWMNGRGHVFRNTDGNAVRMSGIDMDVTERRTLEDELRGLAKTLEARVQEEIATREAAQTRAAHAERLQALGQLASGIAHDFNNVLQAVGGAMKLIGRRPGDEPGIRRLAQLASEAIERGASITRRLLVFGRRGDLRAETIDAATLLHDLREILVHTLGVNIDIEVRLGTNLRPFVADKSQLETSLINLATNARDAMPGGGKLTLAAAIEVVSQDAARHAAFDRRHRRGHGRGHARPRQRAVLHHQGGGRRNWPRPRDVQGVRRAIRRRHSC